MKYALVSMHNDRYAQLASVTYLQNKVIYAERHGYLCAAKVTNFDPTYDINFEKMRIILDLFNNHPDLEWAWWLDCDAMITNYNIKLESIVDNNYHFILSEDINGLNAGSFLVRNSTEGRDYLQMILDNMETYRFHNWHEQQCINDTYDIYRGIIKVLPQKIINCYNYELYKEHYPQDDKWWAYYHAGQWKLGDFVIHWPGVEHYARIVMAEEMLNHIVK